MKKTTVIQFGLGPIGIASVRLAVAHPLLEIVGCVDINPAKVDCSLTEVTEVLGLEQKLVFGSCGELLSAVVPNVVLHTALSIAAATLAQVRPVLEWGLGVMSTCEELISLGLKNAALVLQVYLDALHPHDAIVIRGRPGSTPC